MIRFLLMVGFAVLAFRADSVGTGVAFLLIAACLAADLCFRRA